MIRHVYGNEATSRARCFTWHACFKICRTSLDDKRCGRPSTSSTPENVETIRRLVHEDRRRSINDIAAIIDVSYGTVQANLRSALNLHCKIRAHASDPRSEICAEICQDLHIEGYHSGRGLGVRSVRVQHLHGRRSRDVCSATESMLIVFFDIRAVVHRVFIPGDQTVNGKFYCNVLKRLGRTFGKNGLNCGARAMDAS